VVQVRPLEAVLQQPTPPVKEMRLAVGQHCMDRLGLLAPVSTALTWLRLVDVGQQVVMREAVLPVARLLTWLAGQHLVPEVSLEDWR